MNKFIVFLSFQFFASSLFAVQTFSDFVQRVGVEPERMVATRRKYNSDLERPKVPEVKRFAALIVHIDRKKV